MTGRIWGVGVCFTLLVIACAGHGNQESRAILAALESLAENTPDSVSVCVADGYLSDPDSILPPELQRSLRLEGWHLYDPVVGQRSAGGRALPPGPGEEMIILQDWKKEGGLWVIRTAYTRSDRRSGYVSWGLYYVTHRVSCTDGICEVVDAVKGGHGDGGMPADRFDAYDRPRCGVSAGDPRRDGSGT